MDATQPPEPRGEQLPAVPPYASRWKLVRDLAVFEGKLALDGLKDIVLAPLALLAAIGDLLLGGKRRGLLLTKVARLGERFEGWLSLYSIRPGGRPESADLLGDGGSDVIVDYLESQALEIHRSLKGRREKRRKEEQE
jgi:hypothetical protein